MGVRVLFRVSSREMTIIQIDIESNEAINGGLPNKRATSRKKSKRGSKGQIGGNKRKIQSITTLKKKLWVVVSKRIKERDNFVCYTSGKKVEGANAHCGHGMPNSICGARLRYHPLNLHCQSYYENIYASGNGVQYYQNQVRDYGENRVKELYKLKDKYIKADAIFYQTLIDLYSNGTWEEIITYLET